MILGLPEGEGGEIFVVLVSALEAFKATAKQGLAETVRKPISGHMTYSSAKSQQLIDLAISPLLGSALFLPFKKKVIVLGRRQGLLLRQRRKLSLDLEGIIHHTLATFGRIQSLPTVGSTRGSGGRHPASTRMTCAGWPRRKPACDPSFSGLSCQP